MKKLDEIGISPAPWKISDSGKTNGFIVDAEGIICASSAPSGCPPANARLIASSPKIYDAGQKTEAVLTGLFKLDEFAALLKSGAADALIACRDDLRKALAKASGEENDNA